MELLAEASSSGLRVVGANKTLWPSGLMVRTPRRGRDNPGSTPGAVMCLVLHREAAVLHLRGPLAPLPI